MNVRAELIKKGLLKDTGAGPKKVFANAQAILCRRMENRGLRAKAEKAVHILQHHQVQDETLRPPYNQSAEV